MAMRSRWKVAERRIMSRMFMLDSSLYLLFGPCEISISRAAVRHSNLDTPWTRPWGLHSGLHAAERPYSNAGLQLFRASSWLYRSISLNGALGCGGTPSTYAGYSA